MTAPTAPDNAGLRFLASIARGEGSGARSFSINGRERHLELIERMLREGFAERDPETRKPRITEAGRRVLASNKRKFRR